MTMPTFRQLPISSVANHFSLRCDAKYRLFWGINGSMLFPNAKTECHTLKHALVPFQRRTIPKGDLDEELELVELDDVEKFSGYVISSAKVIELNSAKLLFGNADILTTRLRPNLGKTFLNDPSRILAGTTEWIPVRINHERLHPLLAKWYLLSPRYVENAQRLLSGKEHPRVDESDIFALWVPFPSKREQQRLVTKIQAIEDDIAIARAALRDRADIVNEILCAEFDYPLAEHRERERLWHFSRGLGIIAAGVTLRNSVKYHHPDFELTERFFAQTPHKRLKAYVALPIRLGATATNGDFVEEGAAYYVHPGATKRQKVICIDDCYQVTEDFWAATRGRFGLRRGDVLVNRSGEGTIGKSGLWDSDERAIASDFVMRIRFKEEIDPRFAWFYLQSVMFQAQVTREKRGMGNMTNIFPPQVEQMLIVSCEPTRQRKIALNVATVLATVDAHRAVIESKRKEIEALLDEAFQVRQT